MRGSKAKALRRLAKKSGLPQVAYAHDTEIVELVRPLDEPLRIAVGTRRLGASQKAMTNRSKKRIGDIPLVGLERAQRRALEEIKNMQIIPIPTPEAS